MLRKLMEKISKIFNYWWIFMIFGLQVLGGNSWTEKIRKSQKTFLDPYVRQVESLLRLCLLSPASSCAAERSFSTFRRLKTYLRSTMTQNRLNSLMLCQIHNKYASNMDIGNQIYRNKLHELNYLHSFLFPCLCYSSSGEVGGWGGSWMKVLG